MFLDSSTLDLCSQLTADIESQTVIRADTNSKELFALCKLWSLHFAVYIAMRVPES